MQDGFSAGGLDLAAPAGIAGDLAAAGDYMTASLAPATIAAYRRDWHTWVGYATRHDLPVLPAEPAHVCAFLASYAAGKRTGTVERAAMAIAKAHRLSGLSSPVDHEHVRRTLSGLRRTLGTARRQAAPLDTDAVGRLVDAIDTTTIRGVRDRAMVLVGYVGAFRASELLAIDVDDIAHTADGIVITVRRSKTDQEARGRIKTLPTAAARPALCPVTALTAWLQTAGIGSGAVWRAVHRNNHTILDGRLTIDTLARILRTHATTAGLNPQQITTHSLRAGHVTEAKRNQAPDFAVMRQTHHTRPESIHGYIRDTDPFQHTSATWLGL